MKRNKICFGVALSSCIGSSWFQPILADESIVLSNADEKESINVEKIEKVQVTGSRISRTDYEGADPIQVISREDIELSGVTNIGDLLQTMTSSSGAATNSQVNNGGSGSVEFSLRGLQAKRTLVLVNGRRFVYSGASEAADAVDLSMIPMSLIERVEVLKDGASSLYGSDAVAGVVNIILKNEFNGFEITGYTGQNDEDDGRKSFVSLTGGKSFSKGNILFNLTLHEQKPVFAGDRDYSSFDRFFDTSSDSIVIGGSTSPPWGWMNILDRDDDGNLIQARDDDGNLEFDDDNNPIYQRRTLTYGPEFGDELRDFRGDPDKYNYQPENYLTTPQDRYQATILGNLDVGTWGALGPVSLSTELSYAKRESDLKLAPMPLFAGISFNAPISGYSLYNPLSGTQFDTGNPDDLIINSWRRRMVESGNRDLHLESETTRYVFALDGTFNFGWDWNTFINYGKNEHFDTKNSFRVDHLANAVGASNLDANGNPTCYTDGTYTTAIGGCTPIDIFNPSQAALDYVTYDQFNEGFNEQQQFEFSMNGSIGELPGGSAGLAIGLGWRKERGEYIPDEQVQQNPDNNNQSNDVEDSEGITSGEFDVKELFAEFYLPIADNFSVSLSSRLSDYDLFGQTTNSSVGFEWRPTSDMLFRSTGAQAFRGPSLEELFLSGQVSAERATDPRCALNLPGCDDRDQFDTDIGGNSELEPEEADILTIGWVYAPDFLAGFSTSIDWWSYKIDNVITNKGAQTILDECYIDGNQSSCALISFNDVTGLINSINDSKQNLGSLETNGVDLNLRYAMGLSADSKLSFNLDATYLTEYKTVDGIGQEASLAGTYTDQPDDAGGNFARWRANLSTTYTLGSLKALHQLRYIHDVKELVDATDNIYHKIPSMTYHDVRVDYKIAPINTIASIGIENLFNEDPPLVLTSLNANTDDRTYNLGGRFIYFQTTTRF